MIQTYNKYTNVREAASKPSTETAHGMTTSDIEAMHQRLDKFTPRLASSGPSNLRSQLASSLPEGASWVVNKTAQMNNGVPQFGAGGSNNMISAQTPYQPEFGSIDRQQYPVHRILANRYWRMFHKLDPVIGNCLEMYAELPWSNFEITGDGIEGEIRRAYESMIQESQMLAMLPYFVREFMVVGEAIIHTNFDNSKGYFSHIAMHNPDQIEVIDAPFIKMDPILEFIPDDRLRSVLTSNEPALAEIRKRMPQELLTRLQSKQNIPLSSLNATFIPRKLHPYDTRGTSIISRMWRILMYEDAIFNASLNVARRAASPIKVAKLGNAATGWIPPPEQEKQMLELLAQAEQDSQSWLITHYGVNFELVGAPERTMSINREWDIIERIKLVALGISKSFLHGEVTYACLQEGTKVNTPSGYTQIQDIKIGDQVLDKDGKIETVENAWNEGTPEELIEIHLWGGKKIQSTTTHKWPAWAWLKQCACGCGAEVEPGKCFKHLHQAKTGARYNTVKLKYIDGETAAGGKPRQIPEGYEPIQKLRADELRVGDYLIAPRKFDAVTPNIALNQARLLGYYLAEGNFCKNHKKTKYINTRWTMHYNEFDTWIKDIEDCCASIGVHTSARKYVKKTTSVITTGGPGAEALTNWLHKHGDHMSYNKRLSSDVMAWPIEYKQELVKGMFRGDGSQHFHNIKNRYGKEYKQFIVAYTSVSHQMILQLHTILIQLGYYASIVEQPSRIGKDGSTRRVVYRLSLSGSHARRLADLVWGDKNKSIGVEVKNNVRDRFRVDDDYIYVPIKSITTVKNTKPVYNLTVSGSHSYVAEGFGTYNSASTGLQVFLQRLKAIRMMFEQKWIYPKFFRPIAEINGWTKPKQSEINHRYRIKRSAQELQQDDAYLTPKIVWDKSLDPQINTALIQAMNALEQLGVKFSKTSKMATVGYNFEEETKKIHREEEFEKTFLPKINKPDGKDKGGPGGGMPGGGGGPIDGPPSSDMHKDDDVPSDTSGGGVPLNAPDKQSSKSANMQSSSRSSEQTIVRPDVTGESVPRAKGEYYPKQVANLLGGTEGIAKVDRSVPHNTNQSQQKTQTAAKDDDDIADAYDAYDAKDAKTTKDAKNVKTTSKDDVNDVDDVVVSTDDVFSDDDVKYAVEVLKSDENTPENIVLLKEATEDLETEFNAFHLSDNTVATDADGMWDAFSLFLSSRDYTDTDIDRLQRLAKEKSPKKKLPDHLEAALHQLEAALPDDGAMTDEDFAAKVQQILGSQKKPLNPDTFVTGIL